MTSITPELHAISVFIATLNSVKGWGLPAVFIAIFLFPWVAMILVSYLNHLRFETVVKINEKVVKINEKNIENKDEIKEIMNGFKQMAKDYKDVLIQSTKASLRVEKAIEASTYCPIERERRKIPQGRAAK